MTEIVFIDGLFAMVRIKYLDFVFCCFGVSESFVVELKEFIIKFLHIYVCWHEYITNYHIFHKGKQHTFCILYVRCEVYYVCSLLHTFKWFDILQRLDKVRYTHIFNRVITTWCIILFLAFLAGFGLTLLKSIVGASLLFQYNGLRRLTWFTRIFADFKWTYWV